MTTGNTVTFILEGTDRCGINDAAAYLKSSGNPELINRLTRITGPTACGDDYDEALDVVEFAVPGDQAFYDGPTAHFNQLRASIHELQAHEAGDCECWAEEEVNFRSLVDATLPKSSHAPDFWIVNEAIGDDEWTHCLRDAVDLDELLAALGVRDLDSAVLTWDGDSNTLAGTFNDRTEFSLTPLAADRQNIMHKVANHPLAGEDLSEAVWFVSTLPISRLDAALALADKLDGRATLHCIEDCLAAAATQVQWSPAEAAAIADLASTLDLETAIDAARATPA